MNILIVEDDLLMSIYFEGLIEKLGYSVLANVYNYETALVVIEHEQIDLVLLDIELDGVPSGVRLAELFNAKNTPIIIATSHPHETYYEQIKQIPNCLFLTKPVNIHTLDSAIKLLTQHKQKPSQFLKEGLRGSIIPIKDITFIQVDGTYSYIHTLSKRYAFKKSLKSIKAELPEADFLQIHSSYLVRKSCIKEVNKEKNVVELEGHSLPLSRRAKKEIDAHL